MNKKFISLLVVSLAFVSACAKPASSSTETSKSQSASESTSTSQSASESKSESASQSVSASESTSSSTSTEPVAGEITILPDNAPAMPSTGYPAAGETTISGAKFYLNHVGKNSQQPITAANKKTAAKDIIQMDKEGGALYNVDSLSITKIVLTYLDKTSQYNLPAPVPSVYAGDTVNPLGTKVDVTPVNGTDPTTSYKFTPMTFEFATPIKFFTLANDYNTSGSNVDSEGYTVDDARTAYFTSIVISQ